MSVRSSMQLPSLAAVTACMCMAGAASAQPAAPPAQMTADQLPELGDPVAATSSSASIPVETRLTVARLDLNTPVSRLCANPRAKAVLDTDLPGLTARPEFPFFKSMSLNTLKKMSRGQMSDADLAKVQAELAQLDEVPPDSAK